MAFAATTAGSQEAQGRCFMNVPASMRREVINRASNRCEYCGLAQVGQEAVFHVDHICPVMEGGATNLENLALACVSCSLRKGARQAGSDPLSGKVVRYYHPRCQRWQEHFRWKGCRVQGLTATGRATVDGLKMNRALVQAIRAEEKLLGRHPPPTREP